jgi:hypothetical protein
MTENLDALSRTLSASPTLDTRRIGDRLKVAPRRRIGGRGPLRLLWPAAEGRVQWRRDRPRVSVRPDAWAWLVWIVLAGASVVELLMDRAEFPRDYPAYAPFLALGVYSLLMVVAVVSLSAAIRSAIAR